MTRFSFLLILVAVLAGCAVWKEARVWPDGIPPRSYFHSEWLASEDNQQIQSEAEYLDWITRFYVGNNGVPGWLDMTAQVMERLPQADHAGVSARLLDIGGRIGREWAKDNNLRLLNTRSAAVWRDALLEALARAELDAYLERLESDVEALLAGELDNDMIRFERYYVDEFDC